MLETVFYFRKSYHGSFRKFPAAEEELEDVGKRRDLGVPL
jgi:hypothetical protein